MGNNLTTTESAKSDGRINQESKAKQSDNNYLKGDNSTGSAAQSQSEGEYLIERDGKNTGVNERLLPRTANDASIEDAQAREVSPSAINFDSTDEKHHMFKSMQ